MSTASDTSTVPSQFASPYVTFAGVSEETVVVVVAADVVFHTHDVMEHMFNYMSRDTYKQYIGSIEIFDNCFIGAGSTILYNVKIGPNAIVAAGSVVTKDVPPGTIVGGNPAKVIGSFEKLMTNRLNTGIPDKNGNRDDVLRYFWGNIE